MPTQAGLEQQGEIVGDYFDLGQEALEYESNGMYTPRSLRQDLDVYIYFVQ